MTGPDATGIMTSVEPQVIILTGQKLSWLDKQPSWLDNPDYVRDLKSLLLVLVAPQDAQTLPEAESGNLYFAVTPSFVSTFDSAPGNRLVYAGSCRSYFTPGGPPNPGPVSGVPNATMAQAFVGKGLTSSGSYFGFTEYVSYDFTKKEGTALFNSLTATNGTTTGSAFAPLTKDIDEDEDKPKITGKTGQAQFVLYGDQNLTLPYCAQRSDELAQFYYEDGTGGVTVYINNVAQVLTNLVPGDTRDLGFNDLPASGTYTMVVNVGNGLVDFSINLPPGFAFDNDKASVSNRVTTLTGPLTYHFHSK